MEIKKDKTLAYITYAIVLSFVMFNLKFVFNTCKDIIALATPFYIAIVIAFILNIPMKKIEKILSKKIDKKNLLRGISLALTLILALALIILFSSFIIPKILDSIATIFTNLVDYISSLVTIINKLLEHLPINFTFNLSAIEEMIQKNFDINNFIVEGTNILSETGINIIFKSIGIVGTFINSVTAFMMGLYLLANKETHIAQLKKFITFLFGYKKALNIIDIGKEANHYFNGFVSGQLLECCIFMFLIYIALKITAVPFPELVAVISGVFCLVPMFGAFVGFFINFLLILAVEVDKAFIFAIAFIILQQFEGNVVYPKVVGNAVGISGLYVLLSLVVFGNLFGFVGLLIAVPSMALIYAVASRVINIALYRRHIEVTDKEIYKLDEKGNRITK
ncbi:MAG: AI-2E family transporter [Bacilli bacterium]|nr:AI-2E family transporter [Bacilli bacterium]